MTDSHHSQSSALPRSTVPDSSSMCQSLSDDQLKSFARSVLQEAYTRDKLFMAHAGYAFERMELLGEGGMGSVYRVADHRIGRHAALKVLNLEHKDPRMIQRFMREIQITSALDHPSIPPVFEAGTTEIGQHYMLMKLIDGRTLQEEIVDYHQNGRSMTQLKCLLEMFTKAAEAVAYAHEQGVIHRDLKPENVMIGYYGEVMVMDWGLARWLDDSVSDRELYPENFDEHADAGLTIAGSVLGTPGYMPPEQARGEDVDTRADVFALGALLTEILTGEAPVAGQSASIRIHGTLEGRIVTPRQRLRDAPRELDALATLAMKADKNERMAKATDFVEDLKAFLRGEELSCYRYGLLDRTFRGIRRRPGLVLLVLFLGLLVLAGSFVLQELEQSERLQRQAMLERERQKRESAAAKTAEERLRALVEGFSRARSILERGHSQEQLVTVVSDTLRVGGRSKENLLTAARIYKDAQAFELADQLLTEVVRRFPPSFEVIFERHLLDQERKPGKTFRMTAALKQLIEQADKHSMKNEYTLFARGFQALAQNKYKQAETFFNDLEELSPSFSWLFFYRGYARHQLKKNKAAVRDFNRAIELYPNMALAYYYRGMITTNDKPKAAIKDFGEAIRCRRGYSLAYFQRAVCYQNLRERHKAIRDYSQCLELDPNQSYALNNRGNCKSDLGDSEGAYEDYTEALRLDPKYGYARNNRGNVLLKMKRVDEAIKDLELLVKTHPKYPNARWNLGRAYRRKGRLKDAEKAFKGFLELAPNHVNAARARKILTEIQGPPG